MRVPDDTSPTDSPTAPLTNRDFFLAWLGIGAQSWGGGTATFALIQKTMVETRGWMGEAEFARAWAVCQLSPGINLLSLTILLGQRVGGKWGPLLAMAGLLLPSVVVTLLITASYARVRNNDTVRAAFAGVLPATVGIGLYSAMRTARPLLAESRAKAWDVLAFDVALILLCVFCVAALHLPSVVVVLGAATLSGLVHMLRARRTPKPLETGE